LQIVRSRKIETAITGNRLSRLQRLITALFAVVPAYVDE
jgi:hypothetical protein